MDNNTIENNKLIAEFMGIEFNLIGDKCNHPLISAPWPPVECLRYNSSWDWLMNVVEKIEILGFGFRIGTIMALIVSNNLGRSFEVKVTNSKIEAVYNAVIEFIKWFEKNGN